MNKKRLLAVCFLISLLLPTNALAQIKEGNFKNRGEEIRSTNKKEKRIKIIRNITIENFEQLSKEYEEGIIKTEDEAFQRIEELSNFQIRGIYQVGSLRVNSDEVIADVFDIGLEYSLRVNSLVKKALQRAYELNLEPNGKYKGIENGKEDAFRHAYWNALMVKEFSMKENLEKAVLIAKKVSDNHEKYNKGTKMAEKMDLHNNDRGRRTFSWLKINKKNLDDKSLENRIKYDIDQGLMRYIKNGKLIPTNK